MSRPRGAPVPADKPEMSVKLDYSNIYKENEELEGHLEDHLDDLHKNKYRAWVERRQQLKVIKQQVEVIMRLRAAVNSRQPGESIDIVASSRPRRASRPMISRQRADDNNKDIDPMDVAEMAQNSKTQMRISQEREKFSSKNLFNVRRGNSGLGGASDNHGHRHSNNAHNHNNLSTQATPFSVEGTGGAFFTKRVSVAAHHKISEDSIQEDEYSNINGNNDNNVEKRPVRPSSERPRTVCNGAAKSYMKETVSSRKGGRPKTAMGIASEKGLTSGGESASPSRMSSAKRCRSRRELELLSRLNLSEAENRQDGEKEEDGSTAWQVINQSRRNVKLQELRSQGKELQSRVDRFLYDLRSFNTRKNLNNNRHTGIILYD